MTAAGTVAPCVALRVVLRVAAGVTDRADSRDGGGESRLSKNLRTIPASGSNPL